MKRNNKKILHGLLAASLLLSALAPSLVIARTITSEEPATSTTSPTTSSAPVEATSSSVPEVSSEEAPEVSPEEVTVEQNYEDRLLKDTKEATSPHPSITIEEKKIVADQLTLKGKIKAGGEATSQTELKALNLQQKNGDTWEAVKAFSLEQEREYLLNEESLDFDLSSQIDSSDTEYRIVADYDVTALVDGKPRKKEKHKGHFPVEEVERVTMESTLEEDTDSEEEVCLKETTIDSRESSKDSSETATEESIQSTRDASDTPTVSMPNRDANPVVLPPAPIQKILELTSDTRDVPTLRSGNPLLRSTIVAGDGQGSYTIGTDSTQPSMTIDISSITNTSFDFSLGWRGRYDSTEENWDASPKGGLAVFVSTESVCPSLPNDLISANLFYIASDFANDGGSSHSGSWANGLGKATGLAPGRKYYAHCLYQRVANEQWYLMGTYGRVITTGYQEIYNVSTPTVDVVSPTAIRLKKGKYWGDISQNENDGEYLLRKYGGTWDTVRSNLIHEKKRNGEYGTGTDPNNRLLNNLEPGTKYEARVRLKNAIGAYTEGGLSPINDTLVTPVSLNEISVTEKNTPTTAINAEVKLESTFNMGNGEAQARPKRLDDGGAEVVLKKGSGSWTSVDRSAIAFPSDGKITFSFKNLDAAESYTMRYRLNNGEYSEWKEYSFKTEGISPVIHNSDDPAKAKLIEFEQAIATATSIKLKEGKYKGNVSRDQGKLTLQSGHVTSGTEWKWETKTTELPTNHGGNGKYGSYEITGLTPGTKYGAHVYLKKWGREKTQTADTDYGESSAYASFVTANKLGDFTNSNNPDSTTVGDTTTSAEASFSTSYEAANGTTAASGKAHPNMIFVQVSTDGGNVWSEVKTTASAGEPKLETSTIDKANQKISFKITQLKSRTNYMVRVAAKTEGVVWTEFQESELFTTKATDPKADTPTLEQSDAKTTEIQMNHGRYTGDASKNQGQLNLKVGADSSSWTTLTTELGSIVTSSLYTGYTITGLKAGTKYGVNLRLKKWGKTTTDLTESDYGPWSGMGYFVTPNELNGFSNSNKPAELGIGLTETSATASFELTYKAAEEFAPEALAKAHPKEISVEVKEAGGTWKIAKPNAPAGEPKLETSRIDEGSKKIIFKVTQLKAKKEYEVRVKGKTENVVWTALQGSDKFTTRAVRPILSPPTVDQNTATPNSIEMNPGSYTGEIYSVPNQGRVATESYNNDGGDKDWALPVDDLNHNDVAKTYEGRKLTGLTPGTRYTGWVSFKNYEGDDWIDREFAKKFYTTNEIERNLPTPNLAVPLSKFEATAEFTGMSYQAAEGKPAQVAAHPNRVKVQISTDGGTSWDTLSVGGSGPRLDSASAIEIGTKKVNFKILGLTENTYYAVKYSVINQGGESPVSNVSGFTTQSRAAGFYINEASNFDFGTVEYSESNSTHPLTEPTGEAFVDFENIDVNQNWTLSAKMEKLKSTADANYTLPGSKIVIDKQLVETEDDGATWNPANSSKFNSTLGISNGGTPIELPADGETSVNLFKTIDPTYGQRRFRSIMDRSEIKLVIPGGIGRRGDSYEGKLVWLMDDLP